MLDLSGAICLHMKINKKESEQGAIMTDESNTLQAAYYKQASENLENFMILVQEHAQDNTYVQQAYAELPESVKQGRSLEALAVDEITDVFVTLTYNGKNRRTLYKYYRDLRNMLTDSEAPALSDRQAREELQQRYAELEDADIGNIQALPHFLGLFAENLSLSDTADLAESWGKILQDMVYCAQDKNGLAILHDFEDLVSRYEVAINRVLKNQSAHEESNDVPVRQGDADTQTGEDPEEGDPYAQNDLPRAEDVPEMVQDELQGEHQIRVLNLIKNRYYEYIDQVNKQLRDLGEDVELNSDLEKLKYSVENLPLPDEVRRKAGNELQKLENISEQHPEYNGGVTFLKKLVAWPWGQHSEVNADTGNTREILDADHYGLEPVKERILEQVAVQKRTGHGKAPVICLVGPPGVGKTSIAKSLAQAMGREFVDSSLAGVSGSSHICGWSPSYKDAAPGKIFSGITKAGTENPLFLLDEIDKLSTGDAQSGDPSSTLLAVFDPEQNSAFKDNFMGDDIAFDLSQVMFVTTANDKSKIPDPLRDRMQVIDLEAYVTEEKLEIGKRYLAPRQKQETGVDNTGLNITEDAIRKIILSYAPEAGVRELEQQIGRICAKHAKDIEEGVVAEDAPLEITPDNLEDYLGPTASTQEVKDHSVEKGVVHGLAASDRGGSVLEIKATKKPGDGNGFKLETTAEGEIGGMMERSAKVAASYIESNYDQFGITEEDLKNTKLHVHVLDGGGGVDGPSAGAAFTTTILSAAVASAKGRDIRSDVAMTGTVDNHGKIGAIGGLKQKLDAARNNPNISTVLIPKQNEGDLRNVPQPIRDALRIESVSTIDEVLSYALEAYQPAPVNDNQPDGGPQYGGQPAGPAHGSSGCGSASLSLSANVPFRDGATAGQKLASSPEKTMRFKLLQPDLT